VGVYHSSEQQSTTTTIGVKKRGKARKARKRTLLVTFKHLPKKPWKEKYSMPSPGKFYHCSEIMLFNS
jgi:hypothetical protein